MDLLPNEIILNIASYLQDEDFIVLANVNRRNHELLTSNKRTLKLPSSFNTDFRLVQSFLDQNSKIKQLDFSNCYWIDSHFLYNIITLSGCSLETLIVNGTKLKCIHLAGILKKCPNISHLSVTFCNNDSTFWKAEPQEDDSKEFFLSNCVFSSLQENLRKITKLSLHGDSFCYVKLTIFLCFCTSLEKLHFEISARQQAILEENLHMSHVIGKFRRQLPPCKNLNQLTCAINNVENGGIFLHFLCNILSRKEAQIDLFWVPGIIINQITTRLGKLTALRAVGSYRILQLDIFGHLSSLHTNAPISLLVDKLPYLKVLSCIYDTSIVFEEFASNHKDIQALQFNTCVCPSVSEARLTRGFNHFTRLQKLSLSPVLLLGTDDNPEMAAGLKEIIDCCPCLDEVEIADWTERNKVYDVCGNWLEPFSHCKNLTKFTLADVRVSKSGFVSSILINCSKLQSLRLTNIENSLSAELGTCLQLAMHLEDFRLETKVTEDLNSLVCSLKLCSSLKRWVIVNHSHQPSLKNFSFDWNGLILACFISPNFGHGLLVKVTSDHSAFEWCFGSSTQEAIHLADIHYNSLIVFDSQICLLPY